MAISSSGVIERFSLRASRLRVLPSSRVALMLLVALLTVLLMRGTLLWEGRLYTRAAPPPISLFGLPMESTHLIEAIKQLMVPPVDRSVPYSLVNPNRTRFSQYNQDHLVNRIFKGKRDGVFLEAGALDGERFSNTLYFERELGWTGLLIEPGPISYPRLLATKRKSVVINACLSPNTTAQELLFDISVGPSISKIVEENTYKDAKKTARVPCFPFFSILQAYGNPVIDYMSLDIEGHEMKVLKTIPWDRVKIRLLAVEINHVPEGKAAVRKYLEEQGFKFYKLQAIDYFFYKPDLAEEMHFP